MFYLGPGKVLAPQKQINCGKTKNLHTFKAYHPILRQILCWNTKFQIDRIKNKDAMYKTTQYSTRRQALYINFERIRIWADY